MDDSGDDPALVIASERTENRIELGRGGAWSDPWVNPLRVRLATALFEVEQMVPSGFGDGLATFFGRLEESWRGWEGTRDWFSLEGHLRISASNRGVGQVLLWCTLSDGASPDGGIARQTSWNVQAAIVVEAGALAGLARHAEALTRWDPGLGVMQRWNEHESGWGIRPDGWSLHVDREQHAAFLAEHDKRPQGDEFDRPTGEAVIVRITQPLAEQLAMSRLGLRTFDRTEPPDREQLVGEVPGAQDAAEYLTRLGPPSTPPPDEGGTA